MRMLGSMLNGRLIRLRNSDRCDAWHEVCQRRTSVYRVLRSDGRLERGGRRGGRAQVGGGVGFRAFEEGYDRTGWTRLMVFVFGCQI